MKKLLFILFLFLCITFSFAQLPPAQISAEKNITNLSPLQTLLGANEVFTAGDFPVTVISAQGSNGIYSGTGYIVVPYLADTKVKVSFNNIKLNTDKKLIEGIVETTYDPNESAVAYASAGLGETFGDVSVKEVTIDFPIGGITYSATPPPGKITITGSDGGSGTGSTAEYPGGKDYQFTDSKGNIWTVDENGTVSGPKKPAKGGASTPANTDGVDSSGSATAITAQGIKVEFENKTNGSQSENSKYAFDKPTKALTNDYKEIDGKFIPFKAVENQKTEPFIAKVTLTDTAVKADSLIFKTSKGVAIDAKKVGDTFELTLKGTFSYAKEEVQAVIKQGDKYKVAGVFYLVHISSKTIKLNLVPTSSTIDLENKKQEIKNIYSKVAIDVDISVKPPFDISPYLVDGKLPTADAFGDLSTYSDAQNSIISDYKSKNNVGLEYYIFVTDKPSSTGQDGYMRLNGQFGFVFDQSARTIAHELGHGALKLEHPFKQFSTITKGSTTGLLDYAIGTDFIYTDWKQINDPAFKLYAFQGQESGESTNGASSLVAFLSQNDISEFVYSTQCWWGDGYRAIRFYGKLINGKLVVKEKTFGKITNSNGQVISNDKLSDLIDRSDLDDERNFLIFKTKKGWELIKNTQFENLVDKNCPNRNDDANKEQIAQINKEFQKVSSSILGLDDATYKQLTDNLKAIKKNSRSNQGFELHHWDEKQKKNRYFTLDANNKLQEVENPLTDDQLNNGNWTDNKIDSKTRYTVDNNGIVQLKALGLRKNISLASGKQADLKELSSHILQQTNDYLSKNKVTNFEAKAVDVKTDAFADGKKIEIGNNSTYLKIISEGTGLVTTLLKTAEIEKPTYLDQSDATIKAPGLVTGSVEVVAQKVTDLTSLGTLVYDIAVDEQVRAGLKNQFKEIKNQVGENPKEFFPILGDVILTVTTGNTPEDWKKSLNSSDSGERSHLGTSGVGNAIATVVAGTAIIKELPEIADKLGDAVKKVKKISKTLDDFIAKTLPEKLDDIKDIWKTKYPLPDMFEGRTLFEDIMGNYRYKKANGWAHTADIADNFKGVDFYKDYFELNNVISTKTAISMKTTITKDVNAWLNSAPIKKNLEFLEEGLGEGFLSNGKRMKITEKASIDIYMPKENITPELLQNWKTKLMEVSSKYDDKIEFEIKSLEDYIN